MYALNDLVTLRQAARLIGISPAYLCSLTKLGRVPTLGRLGKSVIIARAAAEALKAEREKKNGLSR